ncbi:MAG: hypothetical protein JO364_06025 [Pseudonocardiales bacterium]|nr:hypothetical protein [Pseudonocardiales bacterium]MBV9029861.1 hypothetical protein [Pseudonocardiales bacterium]
MHLRTGAGGQDDETAFGEDPQRVPRGLVNLVVEKQVGEIIFDPHVTGECVIILDEDPARVLRDALIEWLG